MPKHGPLVRAEFAMCGLLALSPATATGDGRQARGTSLYRTVLGQLAEAHEQFLVGIPGWINQVRLKPHRRVGAPGLHAAMPIIA
jgi:hypothetical protein